MDAERAKEMLENVQNEIFKFDCSRCDKLCIILPSAEKDRLICGKHFADMTPDEFNK